MATRNTATNLINADECTDFQFHKSQRTVFDGCRHKIFDFADYRLIKLAQISNSPERRIFLMDLIQKYRRGDVAIAWRGGQPVYIDITRGG